MTQALEVKEIEKSYGSTRALKGITLSIPQGCVYGILGPNGSGKTTLLGILLDILKQDKGTYEWKQFKSAVEARRHIGSLLETPNFYHYMTAYDNLQVTAQIKQRGYDQIDEVLKKVSLFERRHTKFSTFSLGMKQRLAIAAALLGNPEILVLDEPTNGLDPVGISEIRKLIQELNQEGITIIMASHLLDEVEKVCTDVAILKQGNLLSVGKVADVLSDDDWIECSATNNQQLAALLSQHPGIKEVRQEKMVHASFNNEITAAAINQYCFEHGIVLQHLQKRKASLESIFMELTK